MWAVVVVLALAREMCLTEELSAVVVVVVVGSNN